MKLFHHSTVNRRCGEFIQFPTLMATHVSNGGSRQSLTKPKVAHLVVLLGQPPREVVPVLVDRNLQLLLVVLRPFLDALQRPLALLPLLHHKIAKLNLKPIYLNIATTNGHEMMKWRRVLF